jgi:hypothetical protein
MRGERDLQRDEGKEMAARAALLAVLAVVGLVFRWFFNERMTDVIIHAYTRRFRDPGRN